MSRLDIALRLAKKGFHLFPLLPNSKLPAIRKFKETATRDEAQLRKWFGTGNKNIGISTSTFGDGEHLIALDVDNKNGKRGSDEIARLELVESYDFPDTYRQTTPTHGEHILYKSSLLFKQGTNVLAPGIDVRANGGYVVGEGSVLEGKLYISNDAPVSAAPDWLEKILDQASSDSRSPKEKNAVGNTPVVDQTFATEQATQYLLNTAKPSIQGEGGNHNAFSVACMVKDFGVTRDTCLDLMMDLWNDRCLPPWSFPELQRIVLNAYQYGSEKVGSKSPESLFTPIVPEEEHFLRKMNKEFGIILGSTHYLIHETVDERGRNVVVFMPVETFREKFRNKTVQSSSGAPISYAVHWLNWAHRREYNGVVFAPEREARHGFYNLWRGFTVDPIPPESATTHQKRGLELFLDHALNNVCRGDEKLCHWLLGYFAHLIQKPYERPLTTLVFKGLKGTGKNALIDRVGYLLGDNHYTTVHSPRYLEGNFNSHFEAGLIMVLDEAFWSGSKSTDAALKSVTTNDRIRIERKGKDSYVADNLVRLVVLGNEDWLVPATPDERRYAVFHMGEGRMQDRDYFREMKKCLETHGGAGLLLHYLQNFDLSTVDVDHAPKTEALYTQKIHSLNYFREWWFQCLKEETLKYSGLEGWPTEQLSTEICFDAYRSYLKKRAINKIPNDTKIGIEFKGACPSLEKIQRRDEGKRTTVYKFPSIKQARKDWETVYKNNAIDWEE